MKIIEQAAMGLVILGFALGFLGMGVIDNLPVFLTGLGCLLAGALLSRLSPARSRRLE